MTLPSFSSTLPGFRAAELAIDGLAICCFNSDESFWEVAYLRRRNHKLGITIQELNAFDQPVGDPHTYEVGEDVLSFNISLTNGSEAQFDQYPKGGPATDNFRRNNSNNDPYDLGWMIDLTGPEPDDGDFLGLKPRGGRRTEVTLTRIRHSLLFTSKPDDNPVRLSPIGNGPYGNGSFELGRTNEEISGVLLATAPGRIEFEAEPFESLRIGPFPYDESRRYKIEIINMDTQSREKSGGLVKGDFDFFYDVIDVDGTKKEMWAYERSEGRFAPDGDCNPTFASVGSLQPLIEP